MTKLEFDNIILTFNNDQLKVLQVSIMAERRFRQIYPMSLPKDKSALEEAYDWALSNFS